MQAAAKQRREQSEELPKMSFGDHLDELRRRLILSLAAITICVFGLMPFKRFVTEVYMGPYRTMWLRGFEDHVAAVEQRVAAQGGPEALARSRFGELDLVSYEFLQKWAPSIRDGTFPFADHADLIRSRGGYEVPYTLVASKPIEDIWTFMAASFLFSLLVAGPFVIYQAWAFVAAGLYQHERGVVLRYVPGASALLIAGVLFGYFVVVPFGMYFLVKLMNLDQVQPLITVSTYFSLLFMLTAALGLVFQLPLVMLGLHKAGIVTHATFVKNWRYVVLILFVVASVLTPPDPFTMLMLGVPMCVLYVFGLWLTGRAARREQRAALAVTPGDAG